MVLHYRFTHENDHDFQISCQVDGCARTYRQTASYVKHLKRNHTIFYQHFTWKNSNRDSGNLDALHEYSYAIGGNSCEFQADEELETAENIEVDNFVIDFERKFALFLLKLREKSKLPANAVMSVVHEIIDMIGYHHAEVS